VSEPTAPLPAELDPRIERSRRVIQDAVIAEMAAAGFGAMTVEAVAKRAGVSKATIYRQWKNKLEMVESALGSMSDDMEFDDSVPVKERITYMLTWLATFLADTENPRSACMPALVSAAQYDDDVRAFHHRFSAQRRQVLVDMVRDGQASGDLDASLDPDRITEILVGPLFYRRLMTEDPFPPSDISGLVATVLG
jgi:TetR/AcrR family transcriptional regulator of autoinduction and epiphytic fitness